MARAHRARPQRSLLAFVLIAALLLTHTHAWLGGLGGAAGRRRRAALALAARAGAATVLAAAAAALIVVA